MNLGLLIATIDFLSLQSVFFWWTLEGKGTNFLVQSISSHNKEAIEAIANVINTDTVCIDDDAHEKVYSISFF